MTPERWRQIKDVLGAALDVAPHDRAAVLDRLCVDETMRGEVEKLLALEKRAGDALDSRIAPGSLLREEPLQTPPERIGPYRVLREIGHGGMGVVYLAERADGEFSRQVAIKLITRGRPDSDLARRFRRERGILAQFEHPGIARMLDGGATEDGQPYFVMEYVNGLPLLDYCESEHIPIETRLVLFLKICDVVGHAHQRLIVHRDLKPANILVTAEGSPKLLDFGLARMLDGEQREEITRAGFPVMTPAYASPEQIRGEPFTVSSDVYSLGVVLFELLTGRRPYEVPRGSLLEMVRVVCESEPARLSRMVSDDRLRRALEGDLDTIVAKAVEKYPRRRYESVSALASDLKRHLDGLPVHARPATFWYRAGKMLRRHRVAIPAGALAAILIFTFLGVALWQARQAQRRFDDVRKLAHSIMFDLHDAIAPLPGSTAARALLVRQAMDYLERLSAEASNDPGLAREVALGYERIGTVQGFLSESSLGNVPAALESFQKSAAILSRLGEKSASYDLHRDRVRVLNHLATAYGSAGQFENASRTVDQSEGLAQETLRAHPADPLAIGDLAATESQRADLLTSQSRYDDAIPLREQALVLYDQLATADPQNQERQRSLGIAHKKLAALLGVSGRLEESYQQYDHARVIDEARAAANPSNLRTRLDLSYDYSDMGWVRGQMKDLPGKLALYRRALALRREAAQADPNDFRAAYAVASSTGRIAATLEQMHDPSAVTELKGAVAVWKKLAEKPSAEWATVVELADAHKDLAEAYAARNSWSSAASEYEEARSLYTGLANKGVLPKAQFSKIAELAAQAERCRKSIGGG